MRCTLYYPPWPCVYRNFFDDTLMSGHVNVDSYVFSYVFWKNFPHNIINMSVA